MVTTIVVEQHTHTQRSQRHSHRPAKVQTPVHCHNRGHTPHKQREGACRIQTEPWGHTHSQNSLTALTFPPMTPRAHCDAPARVSFGHEDSAGSMALQKSTLCASLPFSGPVPSATVPLHVDCRPRPRLGDSHPVSHGGLSQVLLEDSKGAMTRAGNEMSVKFSFRCYSEMNLRYGGGGKRILFKTPSSCW